MQQNYQEIYEMDLMRKNEKKVLKMAYLKTAVTRLIYVAFSVVISLPLVLVDRIWPSFALENETLYSAIYYTHS